MFVIFSFHLSDCLIFRKKTETKTRVCGQPSSVVLTDWRRSAIPKRNGLTQFLFLFPSFLPLHCSSVCAGLSPAVAVLSLVLPMRWAGWPLGGRAPSVQALRPPSVRPLQVASPAGLLGRCQGSSEPPGV